MTIMFFIIWGIPILASPNFISDVNIDAPSSFNLNANQNDEIKIVFSGIGIDSIGIDVSGIGLTANIVATDWNAYPSACYATINVSTDGNFLEGILTVNLFNNSFGTIKSQSIAISANQANIQVNDLHISAFDEYEFTSENENMIIVTFSGQGIDKINITTSNKNLSAKIIDTTWNLYPETCSAVISLPSTNNIGGTITFNLINNSLGIVKSHTMRIDYKSSMSHNEKIYIDAVKSYSLEAGKKNQIKIKFCGQGISGVNLDVSGTGISAKVLTVDWNAYPEECLATILVSASKDSPSDGQIVFQLFDDGDKVIKSHCIQIKIFVNSTVQESSEQNELKEYLLSPGYYIIRSKVDENKVLDVKDASKSDEAKVHIWSNYCKSNQIWHIKKTKDGYYNIVAAHSGKYLDVIGGSNKKGVEVWQYSKNDSDAQKWKFYVADDDHVYISPKCASNLFLDVENGNSKNGTSVQMYERNTTNAQMWKFEYITKSKKNIKPLIFKDGMIIDGEFEVPYSFMDEVRDDLMELISDKMDISSLKTLNNFYSFIGEMNGISKICDQIPTIPDRLEIPQAVAIQIRENNFKNLQGMKYSIEDDNIKHTYFTYIYSSYGSYNFAIFEMIEEKSWGEWQLRKIRLTGGFSVKISNDM